MAEKDPGDVESRLELPSFGFGRKKRKRGEDAPAVAEETAAPPVEEAQPERIEEARPEPEPVTRRSPSAPSPAPTSGEEATLSMPQTVAEPPPTRRVAEDTPLSGGQATESGPETVADAPPAGPVERRPARGFSLPALPPLQATLITGLVVGLLAVGLNYLAMLACDAIRGTTSCGGPGFLLLLGSLILITYVGAWLLRGFRIEEPGSTAFLAVGLLTVVVMLFLVDALFSWWMVVVIPVLAMLAFLGSWKLTTSFADVDIE